MSLTGWPFTLFCTALPVVLPLLALRLWGRVRGGRAAGTVQRVGMIVVCQSCAVLVTAVWLNRSFLFYASWHDLLGTQDPGAVVADTPDRARDEVRKQFASPESRKHGALVKSVVVGPSSQVKGRLYVYLPPQYETAGDRRFPVVEFFSGHPGTPQAVLAGLHLLSYVEGEVTAGRMQPAIFVLPDINVSGTHDNECVNVAGGPAVQTWLTDDVRSIVLRNYRALPDRHGWGLMGYSTGGFCATKLALQRPDQFAAAVSMSGYLSFGRRGEVEHLFGGDVRLERENSPAWLATRVPSPDLALLLTASAEDGDTAAEAKSMAAAAQPPLRVGTLVAPTGGHNPRLWMAQLPACLDWMSGQLVAADQGGRPPSGPPTLAPRPGVHPQPAGR